MNIKEFSQSHKATIGLAAIAAIVLMLASFSLGQYVGFRKASFAIQNGNNFYRQGPRGGPMLPPGDFSDAHGSAGKVIGIALPEITIQDKDNTEKVVVVSDKTVIRQFRDTLKPEDIAVGDIIVAIGEPNAQSQIEAGLIRILPRP